MKISRQLTFLAFAGLVAAFPVRATEETPYSIPGGAMVTVDQAKVEADKGALFVDSRVAAEYAEKRIKGAINVTYKEQFPRVAKTGPEDKFDMTKLPADKGKALIFYCNGSPCWKAYKAAELAIKAGYKKVFWFRDGLPAWVAKGLPTE